MEACLLYTSIRESLTKGKTGEGLFFDLALDDLTRAADLFRPIYDRTNGVDAVSYTHLDDEDDEGRSTSERLVEEGVLEAEHDQMRQAAKKQKEDDK